MKNRNRPIVYLVSIILLAAVLGCGFLGGDKIENSTIDADLGRQELATKRSTNVGTASTWKFPLDQGRCFNVLDSKIEGDTAVITLSVASYFGTAAVADSMFTVFGEVVMNYKRDGKTWTLQKAEGKELIEKMLTLNQFKEWLDTTAPLCRNYRAKLKL
jgi:hypothetical protein